MRSKHWMFRCAAAIKFKNRSNAFLDVYMLFIALSMICLQSMTRNVWYRRHSFCAGILFLSLSRAFDSLHFDCKWSHRIRRCIHFPLVAKHLKPRLLALFELASVFFFLIKFQKKDSRRKGHTNTATSRSTESHLVKSLGFLLLFIFRQKKKTLNNWFRWRRRDEQSDREKERKRNLVIATCHLKRWSNAFTHLTF